MPDLVSLAGVAAGGGLGAAFRHLVAVRIERRCGERFLWGVLVVNLTGSAALGALAAALPDEAATLRLVVGTGFLGGYTTVSAFSLQTLALVEAGEAGRAAAYVAASVAGALAATAAGFAAVAALAGG